MKNFYEILGVERDAHLSVIKKAYKEGCLKFHPDKNLNSEANEQFYELKIAYHTLSDVHLRALYDDELKSSPSINEKGEPFLQIEGNEIFKAFEIQSRFTAKGALFVFQKLKEIQKMLGIENEKLHFKEGVPCSLPHCINFRQPIIRIISPQFLPFEGAILLFCPIHFSIHLCDNECTTENEYCPLYALWRAQQFHRGDLLPPPLPPLPSARSSSSSSSSSSELSSNNININNTNNNNNNNNNTINNMNNNINNKSDQMNSDDQSSSSNNNNNDNNNNKGTTSDFLGSNNKEGGNKIKIKEEDEANSSGVIDDENNNNNNNQVNNNIKKEKLKTENNNNNLNNNNNNNENKNNNNNNNNTNNNKNKQQKYKEGYQKAEEGCTYKTCKSKRLANPNHPPSFDSFVRLEKDIWVCRRHPIPHICNIFQCDRLQRTGNGDLICWATAKEYQGMVHDVASDLNVNLSTRKRLFVYNNDKGERVEYVVDVPWGLECGEAIPEIENSKISVLAKRLITLNKEDEKGMKKRKRSLEIYDGVEGEMYHQYVGILDKKTKLDDVGDYDTTLHGRIGDMGDHDVAEEENEDESEVASEYHKSLVELATERDVKHLNFTQSLRILNDDQ